jgi:hypothetical protein
MPALEYRRTVAMTGPYYADPVSRRSGPRIDAGRLWAGGLATALVVAMIAVAGVVIIRGVFDIALLAPKGAGVWGDASTVWYVAGAAACALLATALMHLLVLFTPRPVSFFAWIIFLATATATAAPFAADAATEAKVATALLNLILGVAIGSLVTGTTRSAIRTAEARALTEPRRADPAAYDPRQADPRGTDPRGTDPRRWP